MRPPASGTRYSESTSTLMVSSALTASSKRGVMEARTFQLRILRLRVRGTDQMLIAEPSQIIAPK